MIALFCSARARETARAFPRVSAPRGFPPAPHLRCAAHLPWRAVPGGAGVAPLPGARNDKKGRAPSAMSFRGSLETSRRSGNRRTGRPRNPHDRPIIVPRGRERPPELSLGSARLGDSSPRSAGLGMTKRGGLPQPCHSEGALRLAVVQGIAAQGDRGIPMIAPDSHISGDECRGTACRAPTSPLESRGSGNPTLLFDHRPVKRASGKCGLPAATDDWPLTTGH